MLNPTPGIAIPITTSDKISTLQVGRSYAGIIRAQPDGLVALVGGTQIPLDTATGLESGQRVLVQVFAEGETLQLNIRPQSTSAPAAPPHSATALLAAILESAGQINLARNAATLLPRQAPADAAALRALVSLLLAERNTGQDIQQLQQFIANATNQGILSPEVGGSLSPWLALTALADSVAWQTLLRQARSERNAAARLAQLLGGTGTMDGPKNLHESLASLTQRLLGDQAFQTWLRDQGMEKTFKALTERVLERATGSDVQNLRSLDQPYQFLQLPLSKEQGFNRLQVHFFPEGGQRKEQSNDGAQRTVLDLDLTNLGPLWIDLRTCAHHCQCRFRVTSPGLVCAVEESASELEQTLEKQGYTNTTITVEIWDGDQEEALLSLLAPFQALNLEA